MAIIKDIINSAKKTWRGEEDPVKVFYTWGLACYIILPLFTAGLGYLSLSFILKIFNSFGVVIFTLLTPFFMLLLVAPLITYTLCSKNIHNVKAKNIKIKKRIVRGLLFDINIIFSIALCFFLIAYSETTKIIVLFIFSNTYRYYKYNLKHQLIFDQKLLNYKISSLYIAIKSFVAKLFKKRFCYYDSNQIIEENNSKKPNINSVKIIIFKAFYLPIFITKIILDILYLPFFVFAASVKIIFVPIIAVLKEFSKLVITVLLATIILLQFEQNQLNRFKKGFYFEKYSEPEDVNRALLQLNPIGSDVNALVKTLERAGGKEYNPYDYYNNTNKSAKKYQKPDDIMYFSYRHRPITSLFSRRWSVCIKNEKNKILRITAQYQQGV